MFYPLCQVSTNGLLSLNTTSSSFTPEKFPTDDPIIAPFWADADTTCNGSVYYTNSSITNVSLLNRAADIINTAFTDANFVPQQLYVITWFEVDYYRSTSVIPEVHSCISISLTLILLFDSTGKHISDCAHCQ